MSALTYVVDLNDVFEDHPNAVTISLQHTRDYGRNVRVYIAGEVGLQEGDHVKVWSGDEDMTWDARVVKQVNPDCFAVEVYWESGLRSKTRVFDTGVAYTRIAPTREPVTFSLAE